MLVGGSAILRGRRLLVVAGSFLVGARPLFGVGGVCQWVVWVVDGHCHCRRVEVDAGGWVAILCGWWLMFMGAESFFVGAWPLFGGGEVCGWVVCMVDGHCHCWRVGRLFFMGSACHLCKLGGSSWVLGCYLWVLSRCLRVVRFVGGRCVWLMGVVIVGGWGVDAGGLVGCSSWVAVVVRTVSLFVAVGLSFVGDDTCWWAVCVIDG